jgi:NADH:ubiquinone oxidoreductase subunit E
VTLCQGTACHVSGAKSILDAIQAQLGISSGGTTTDGRITLETVACIGACALSPVMVIDEECHGPLGIDDALALIGDLGDPQAGDGT